MARGSMVSHGSPIRSHLFSASDVPSQLLPRFIRVIAASQMDPELIRSIFDSGFMGVEIDEAHGGAGSSFTAANLVIEEFAKADPAVSVMVDIHNTIINNCFSMWASAELQGEWLPRLATDTLGAFCLSEASSGSDAFALKTTARREPGGDYILDGEKMWISNSAEAGVRRALAASQRRSVAASQRRTLPPSRALSHVRALASWRPRSRVPPLACRLSRAAPRVPSLACRPSRCSDALL